jgi:hypothetical protein
VGGLKLSDNNPDDNEVPFWLSASASDVDATDFEAPLKEVISAQSHDLHAALRSAQQLQESLKDLDAQPAARVFSMLAAVMNFHFKPSEPKEPFGPMAIFEGRRTAIPDDFRGAPVEVLAKMAKSANNPTLKARLSDVCWLLERSRKDCAIDAVSAYVEIVSGLQSGRFTCRSDADAPFVDLTARDSIQRALSISRTLEKDNPCVLQANEMIIAQRACALKLRRFVPVHWFFEIDLRFGISSPNALAEELKSFLETGKGKRSDQNEANLWRLAARAYHLAGDEAGMHKCKIGASEVFARAARASESALQASHWMSAAISELHGIPNVKDIKASLRKELIDLQVDLTDEMTPFSHSTDISNLVEGTVSSFEECASLSDALKLFSRLTKPAKRADLELAATEQLSKFPLSQIFGATTHDRSGKILHKVAGGDFGEASQSPKLKGQIAQHESLRRNLVVQSRLKPAIEFINERWYVGQDTLADILLCSPFVPTDLSQTYIHAFKRFFAGDYVSALYILTPLLEASLRQVLILANEDVTVFDTTSGTQQDRSLSSLMNEMRAELETVFGQANVDELERIFLQKPGPTLRHDVAHGLLNDGDPYGPDALYACWFIFRLICIPVFSTNESLILPE